MGPRGRFYPYLYHCDYIGLLGTGFMQVMSLGRAPRTKETLPDFLKWRRVTRHPLIFRGLTGSQRTPGNGASQVSLIKSGPVMELSPTSVQHNGDLHSLPYSASYGAICILA